MTNKETKIADYTSFVGNKLDPDYEVILKKLKTFDSVYINDVFLIVKNNPINKKINIISVIKSNLMFLAMVFLSLLINIINLPFLNEKEDKRVIALARVNRVEKKIIRVFPDVRIISDSIKNLDFTIYRIGKRSDRAWYIFKDYIKDCLISKREIDRITRCKEIASYEKDIKKILYQRIPHSVIYYKAISELIKLNKNDHLITGQMYDRFALIEKKVAKEHNMKIICIPHGVETVNEHPGGYVGDLFYCSSPMMRDKLNELYGTNKFIYDEEVISKMLRTDSNITEQEKKLKVVFFTQPIYKNETIDILRELSSILMNSNTKLYIKVHPLENQQDYLIHQNIEVISDFNDSIQNNICVSVISTSLLEGLYNESVSVSIINMIKDINFEDGALYFLNDSRIFKPKNNDELLRLIFKFLN